MATTARKLQLRGLGPVRADLGSEGPARGLPDRLRPATVKRIAGFWPARARSGQGGSSEATGRARVWWAGKIWARSGREGLGSGSSQGGARAPLW